ncbi:hypothetical protein [Maribacter sp. R77961]|uniref:hypothetical protein n=1 Tax=Maribacter sp. R77961 TaxID=3093871 RepID=UPI0037CCC1D2
MFKIKIGSLLLLLALTVSCNFTEEIFLQENGSGKISINFDGSELMQMGGDEMMAGTEKAIDSTLSFKQFLEEKKDSIAELSSEQQAKLKKLAPFNLHMIMNPETKEMKFDMYSSFDNINEVGDAFNTFQNMDALSPAGRANQTQFLSNDNESSEVSYNFKDHTFSRTAKILNTELHQQAIDSLAGAELFLTGSTYTLKYHFPKRVKSASTEKATFSADGKTMIYEVGFLDLMKNPEILNIEVELEQ